MESYSVLQRPLLKGKDLKPSYRRRDEKVTLHRTHTLNSEYTTAFLKRESVFASRPRRLYIRVGSKQLLIPSRRKATLDSLLREC